MNAPTTPQQQIALLPIADLHPSPTNPRKRFDEAKLRELANSVKAIGIAQPILVRAYNPLHGNPLPNKTFEDMQGTYEIVAGERRLRAAKIAGLAEVPCFIRELTNQQVLYIQLIENLQRDDLHPIEEAEGYERLMQEKDANGNPYTADTIAAEIGKSRSYVFQRRKLLALCHDARQAFHAGKLDASTALLIARIPVEKLQLQALKKLTEEVGWGNQFIATGDKMTFRRARDLIQAEFMLDLDRAPFDRNDTDLLPKAGSCTGCDKRTGNAPDLFEDVNDADVCTDTVCFGMKKAAHVLELQKQAEAEGAAVIKGKEAKKLIPSNYNPVDYQLREHGYATLDTPVPGDKKKRTLGQLLEETKAPVQKTVIANPHREGQMIQAVSIEQATKALREAGFEITLKGSSTAQQQSNHDKDKQREKEKAELELENKYRARLFDTLHEQIEAEMGDPAAPIFPKINALLAAKIFELCGDNDDVLKIIRKYDPNLPPDGTPDIDWHSHVNKFEESIPNLTAQQHSMLILDLLILEELTIGWYRQGAQPETMLQISEIVGIDADAMRKEIVTEARVAAKTKAKAEKKPETPAPAAPTTDKQPAKKAAAKKPAAKDAGDAIPPPQAPKVRPDTVWPFPTMPSK